MDNRIKRLYEIILQEEIINCWSADRKGYIEFFLEWKDKSFVNLDDNTIYVRREITAIEKPNKRRN